MPVSSFILFHVGFLSYQHHLMKRLSLLLYIAFALLSKIGWLYIMWVYSWAILFHWSICLFFHKYHAILLNYCSFKVVLEVDSICPPTLSFSFDIRLAIMGLCLFHANFIRSLLISIKIIVCEFGLHWIDKWSCEKLASWQNCIFLPMHVENLSINLVLFIHSSEFYSFLLSKLYVNFVRFIPKNFILGVLI